MTYLVPLNGKDLPCVWYEVVGGRRPDFNVRERKEQGVLGSV